MGPRYFERRKYKEISPTFWVACSREHGWKRGGSSWEIESMNETFECVIYRDINIGVQILPSEWILSKHLYFQIETLNDTY